MNPTVPMNKPIDLHLIQLTSPSLIHSSAVQTTWYALQTPPTPHSMAVPSTFFALSPAMVLNSQSDVFLGEKVKWALTLRNEGISKITDVRMQMNLRNTKGTSTAFDSSQLALTKDKPVHDDPLRQMTSSSGSVGFTMEGKESKTFIVDHLVTEMGPHHITCTARYNLNGIDYSADLETRLDVRKALQLVTMSKSVSEGNATWMAHLEVRNVTNAPLYLESIVFIPENGLRVDDMKESVLFSENRLLGPLQVTEFVMRVRRGHVVRPDTLGYFQVGWRRSFGIQGQVLTQSIPCPGREEKNVVELEVLHISDDLIVEIPFKVTFRLFLCTNPQRRFGLKVSVGKEANEGILCVGPNSQSIGDLQGGSYSDFSFTFVSTAVGLHSLGPICISHKSKTIPHHFSFPLFIQPSHHFNAQTSKERPRTTSFSSRRA